MSALGVLACLAWLAGCSGGGANGGGGAITPPSPNPNPNPNPNPTPSVTVTVSPATATTVPGTDVALTATITGTTNSPTWFVNDILGGNASVGTVASSGTNGIYSPPASVVVPTDFVVKATAVNGSASGSGTATVTVNPPPMLPPAIQAVCTASIVAVTKSVQCSAISLLTGAVIAGADWSVSSVLGGNSTFGTISESGLYVAPNEVPDPQRVTISVVDQANSRNIATTFLVISHHIPSGEWERTGPPGGGFFTVLAEDSESPGLVIGASNVVGGLWMSTNYATSWRPLFADSASNFNPDNYPLSDLAVFDEGRTIYASSIGPFFFRSNDTGATWTTVTVASVPGSIRAMAVDPHNSSTIYLSALDQGIYKSDDGGSSWRLLSASPQTGEVLHHALKVDPIQTNTIYYGTDHGLYISQDWGETWSPPGLGGRSIRDLVVSPADPSHILALAGFPFSTVTDLYGSTDRGMSWVPMASGLDGERIVPDLFDVNVIYLYGLKCRAVYKSTDAGLSFAPSDSGMPSAGSTCPSGPFAVSGPTGTMIHLSNPSTFVATSGGAGIFRSTDAAANWSLSGDGMSLWSGSDVAIDVLNPATIYLAADFGGIFKSNDGGLTWIEARGRPGARLVAVDPFDSNHVLAWVSGEGLLESHDAGSTWQNISSRLPTPPGPSVVMKITFHRSLRGTVFLSTNGGGVGIVKSADGGSSWRISNAGLTNFDVFTDVVEDPSNANILFIGTRSGVFKSTDGGDSWSSQIVTNNLEVSSIAIDELASPPTLYAAASGSLYKSSDSGGTWTQTGTVNAKEIAIDPTAAASIFVVSASGQTHVVNWSPDGGITWLPLTDDLGHVILGKMDIARSTPQVLFVVSPNNSILRLAIGP